MKIIDPGHVYEIQDFESDSVQRINFVKKEPIAGSTELKTVLIGTTNEEVLAVLIDRLSTLNGRFPCRENSIVITKLEESLMWLNKRTAERKARNVEGKQVS